MNELWWSCPHHDLSDSGSISTLFNYLLISANIFFMYLCRYTKIFVIFWTIYKIQHTVTETKIQIQRHSLCRVPLGCSLITQCLADLLKKKSFNFMHLPTFSGAGKQGEAASILRRSRTPRSMSPGPSPSSCEIRSACFRDGPSRSAIALH